MVEKLGRTKGEPCKVRNFAWHALGGMKGVGVEIPIARREFHAVQAQ